MAAPTRLLFIDNLRSFAISMVVVMHAAVTYSPFGNWYWRDNGGTGFGLSVALATYQSFQHAVAMGLLFGIAGYFARASLVRKGPAGFMRERLFRLGLPLLLYLVLIGPLTQYYLAGNWRQIGFLQAWQLRFWDGRLLNGSGPLWFCLVLLVFSAVTALRWRLAPPAAASPPGAPPPRAPAVLAVALAMAGLAFAVGLACPADTSWRNLTLHDLPQYPLMFWAGMRAQRDGWLTRLPKRLGYAWGWAGLGLGTLGWIALITLGGAWRGDLGPYNGGWHWQSLGMDLWRGFVCVSLALGLVTLFRERFATQGPLAAFLSRAAFGVYVFHPPILIALTRVLHEWPLAVGLKFLLAATLAITLSFLFVGLVARRTPGLRAIL